VTFAQHPLNNPKSPIRNPKNKSDDAASSHFDVAILGGGLSGLAAAVKLSLGGARVALFERAGKLGGRCYSYVDEATGDVVDNGQHVLVGAYHHTLHYLELIGTRGFLRRQPRLSLPLHHPTKGFCLFEVSSLPRPFHLSAGMLTFKLLSLRERRRLLNVGLALSSWTSALERELSLLTIDRWLDSLNQSAEAKRCLWYPVAISMMNEHPERASALLFARSLRATFLGRKSDSAILIPQIGQTELYAREAESLIVQNRGVIFTNAEVVEVEMMGSKVIGVRLKNGRRVSAKHVISALPYFALRKIMPARVRNEKPFIDLSRFESSPIISLHLWFDRDFMNVDYVGFIGRTLQWVFNRRRIVGDSKTTGYISAVLSGAYGIVDEPKEKLIPVALQELREVFPEARQAKLIHSVVIKEKRATFSATNDVEPYRPSPETPVRNFYLAGDWTNTGLPATIEGAVMSGFKAAELVKKAIP
jgi:squalene-associated FAD-dependent desaturase